MHDPDRPGTPSGFGCPDCAGALFAIEEGPLHRFRCRVGHAWSPDSLMARQTVALESALWMALRSLEEKAVLSSDMETRARSEGRLLAAGTFGKNAAEALQSAELVRQLVAELGARGVDLTDRDAVDTALRQVNAERVARRLLEG